MAFVQDKRIDANLTEYDQTNKTELRGTYATELKQSLFGEYQSIDAAKLTNATAEDQQIVKDIQESAKKEALKTVALFPVIMLVTYLFLIFYFRSKGGYKPIALE